MKLRFDCPQCSGPGRVEVPGCLEWHCPACQHFLHFPQDDKSAVLHHCLVCGCEEFYKKKDFPHRLGMAILTLACLASIEPYRSYQMWLVWTIMLGSLAFDVVLYRVVGDVVVCYKCMAQYRGLADPAGFPPHDLGITERHRQEKIRREQLRAAKKMAD